MVDVRQGASYGYYGGGAAGRGGGCLAGAACGVGPSGCRRRPGWCLALPGKGSRPGWGWCPCPAGRCLLLRPTPPPGNRWRGRACPRYWPRPGPGCLGGAPAGTAGLCFSWEGHTHTHTHLEVRLEVCVCAVLMCYPTRYVVPFRLWHAFLKGHSSSHARAGGLAGSHVPLIGPAGGHCPSAPH